MVLKRRIQEGWGT